MGRVDADVVLVRQHDLVERAEHRPGVRQRVLRPEQVRPADRPDEQRAAGEQEQRLVGPRPVGDRVGDVLRRVARRLENGEPQLAHVERLAVADRPVLVSELRTRSDHVRRAGQRGEVPPARDVVVVEVRLDDVTDSKVVLAGRIEIDVDVAPRIDDRGKPRSTRRR